MARPVFATLCILLVAGACSSGSDEATDVRLDAERHAVSVQVTTVGDRSVEGLEIWAQMSAPGEPVEVFELHVVDDISVVQPTCAEATAMAIDMAEALAADRDPDAECIATTRRYDEIVDTVRSFTDTDGVATLELVTHGSYHISGGVEVVEGDDGCHFADSINSEPGATEIVLELIHNTCE